MHQTFASPPGEAFYGFGERYNALNQRGNTLDVRVFDQYKSQGKRTYCLVSVNLMNIAKQGILSPVRQKHRQTGGRYAEKEVHCEVDAGRA